MYFNIVHLAADSSVPIMREMTVLTVHVNNWFLCMVHKLITPINPLRIQNILPKIHTYKVMHNLYDNKQD